MNSFRPVQEIWGTNSACFIKTDQLLAFCHDLAARIGTGCEDNTYGDQITVWFEDGNKVLDYIESDPRFCGVSFCESLAEQGITVDEDDLNSLFHNMKSLAPGWRRSLGTHGELVFYID